MTVTWASLPYVYIEVSNISVSWEAERLLESFCFFPVSSCLDWGNLEVTSSVMAALKSCRDCFLTRMSDSYWQQRVSCLSVASKCPGGKSWLDGRQDWWPRVFVCLCSTRTLCSGVHRDYGCMPFWAAQEEQRDEGATIGGHAMLTVELQIPRHSMAFEMPSSPRSSVSVMQPLVIFACVFRGNRI